MIDYKKTAIKLLGMACVCAIVLLLIYLGIQFWPFLIGIVLALVLEKPVEFFMKKLKVSRKFIGTAMVILTFILLASLLGNRESLDFFGVFGVVLFVVNSNNAITYLIKDKKHNDKEIKEANFKLEVCEALLKEMQEQK